MPSARLRRGGVAALATGALLATGLTGALADPAGAATHPSSVSALGTVASGTAPGAPGVDEPTLPADKAGIGTSRTTTSPVWFSVQKEGGLGELFYPTADSDAGRALQLVVADRRGHAWVAGAAGTRVTTTQTDPRSLAFRQTVTGRGWRLVADYAADPARASVLAALTFTSTDGHARDLYAVFDPALDDTRGNDAGSTSGRTLVGSDDGSGVGTVTGTGHPQASAFAARPMFTATSNGLRGTSDGWTDLLADGRMDARYASSPAGNLVQTGLTGLDGTRGRQHTTVGIAFAGNASTAIATLNASFGKGFATTSANYAAGWHRYVDSLHRPPAVLTAAQRRLWTTSALVLAAAEDKTHRGAFVAAPASPWAFGGDDPSDVYHLVWSRDLYQIATGLAAAGDVAGARRAVDFLFGTQQKPDGSFPQNSRVDGTPVWGGLQMDEVGLPIVLAYQVGRTDAATWAHVKRAADFMLGFRQDGFAAPWTPQERWENQAGYSPGTIAAEIAGLVCAAAIATDNGDDASARRYLATADDWRSKVTGWTATTTGPYSSKPYFLRLTKDGKPDLGTTYSIGDSGPVAADQRTVVDPSFLELVRLGVLPASDPVVRNSLAVVDAQLGVTTGRGTYWHRASFDGYGEQADGSRWEFGETPGSQVSRGRLWPLLNGERGEYQLAAGARGAARSQIGAITRAQGPGGMLPEQVWDLASPAGSPGFAPGTPTFSATPLAWTHAQFLRLAADVQAGRILEQPAAVAARYLPQG